MSDVLDIGDLDLADRVIAGETIAWGGYSDISHGTLLVGGSNREVAIKSLRVRGPSGTQEAKDRLEERLRKHFYREILLWRTLEHRNIVPLLGYLMPLDAPPSLISPWYINGNVICYLESNPSSNRRSLALDVVNGLDYLHSIPVAHGDLKGENVLVDSEGKASLCDFGMSQFIDDAQRIVGFTTTNANNGGTDRFMCPEVLEDERKSPATDMWAVGCLIVQILTDEIPYQHIEKKSAVYAAVLRGKLPFLERNAAIDISLWECIKTCWNFTPSDRPTASKVALYLPSPEELRRRIINDLAPSKMLRNIRSWKSGLGISPDGKYLAVPNRPGTVNIWDVGGEIPILLKNLTTGGFILSETTSNVDWSPSQTHVVVNMMPNNGSRVIGVETNETILYEGLCTHAKFSFDNNVFGWMAGFKTIIIKDLTRLKNILHTIDIRLYQVNIIDFAFFPDNQRVVILTDKGLAVYNLITAEFETSTPIIGQFEKTSVSKCGGFILVIGTSEDPHLWGMKFSHPDMIRTELTLLRHFKISSTVENSLISTVKFGGPKDELVLAGVGSPGQIQIWDRDTASLIRSIRGQSNYWNPISFSLIWNSLDPKDVTLAIAVRKDIRSTDVEIWTVPSYGVSYLSD